MLNESASRRHPVRTWCLRLLAIAGLFVLYQVAEMPLAVASRFHRQVWLSIGFQLFALILLGLLAWGLVVLYRRQPAFATVLNVPKHRGGALASLLVLLYAGNLIVGLLNPQTPLNQSVVAKLVHGMPVTLTIMTVLLAPVIEEVVFRGLMYRWLFNRLTNWPRVLVAVVVTTLLFALAHNPSFDAGLLHYLPMALVFSVTYLWFQDLRYSLTLHVIINGIGVLALLLGAS